MSAKNIDYEKVLEREDKILLNEGIDPKFNHQVSKEVQELFEHLNKLYTNEMEWEKNVMKCPTFNLVIKPPYKSKNVEPMRKGKKS